MPPRGVQAFLFPFLFGGTFIEGPGFERCGFASVGDFPSFSEGLSLREFLRLTSQAGRPVFPFLFGGTFIEALSREAQIGAGAFISLPFRRDFH